MKLSNYLRVEPVKTMFGKRNGKWIASFGYTGDASAEGKDGQEAMDNLCRNVNNEFAYRHTRKYLTKGKVTFCLFYAMGWWYDIFNHETQHVSGCAMSCKTYNEALDQMTNHFNQYEG